MWEEIEARWDTISIPPLSGKDLKTWLKTDKSEDDYTAARRIYDEALAWACWNNIAMQDYRLEEYGKPRFHICKCQTIQEFISSGGFREHYVRANSDPVPVKNMNNFRRVEIVSELPLCRYCRNQVMEYGNITSKKFVELLKEARGVEEEQEAKEVDIFGYTRDWDEISREYREKHDYTCERCGLKITDLYYRQYIHCHHKDKNKLNNKESNLECLCMRCHSEVDQYHQKNLTTGANGIMMQEFNKKFPPKEDNKIHNRDNNNSVSIGED